MNVADFEHFIWERDGLRIVVRCSPNLQVKNLPQMPRNPVEGSLQVAKYCLDYLLPHVGDAEIVILQGNGERPHRSALIRSVRKTYG